jgi:CRISPR/Cas system-associated protein Cas10 (large subunit of type III CRISPR-Cas system)
MQKNHGAIVCSSRCSQRPLLTDQHCIDGRMAADFTHRVSTVGCYAVAETLSSITDGNDALGVAVPGYVVYSAGDDVVVA